MTPADLRRWRDQSGLTQKTAAESLGVAANTVARWERGELAIPHWVPLLIQARGQADARERKPTPEHDARLRKLCGDLLRTVIAKRKQIHAEHERRRIPIEDIPKSELLKLLNLVEDQLRKTQEYIPAV